MSNLDEQRVIALEEYKTRISHVEIEDFEVGFNSGADQSSALICESLGIDVSGSYGFEDNQRLIENKLEECCDELTLYRDAYLKLREAVEFYSCKNNWRKNSGSFYVESDKGSYTTIAFMDVDQKEIRTMYKNQVGGKRARQAIKEVDEILKA